MLQLAVRRTWLTCASLIVIVILPFLLGGGTRATDNTMMSTVMVTSDQPIVVGMQMANGPLNAVPCNALPK